MCFSRCKGGITCTTCTSTRSSLMPPLWNIHHRPRQRKPMTVWPQTGCQISRRTLLCSPPSLGHLPETHAVCWLFVFFQSTSIPARQALSLSNALTCTASNPTCIHSTPQVNYQNPLRRHVQPHLTLLLPPAGMSGGRLFPTPPSFLTAPPALVQCTIYRASSCCVQHCHCHQHHPTRSNCNSCPSHLCMSSTERSSFGH